jgi:hypothetical protein
MYPKQRLAHVVGGSIAITVWSVIVIWDAVNNDTKALSGVMNW